ncbi:hypothetical protein EXS56_01875 [Candidatus Kaiserbacteria bacterium]|nr:hypothetical protein [Candidatus Kaiserbacteria bacterium]
MKCLSVRFSLPWGAASDLNPYFEALDTAVDNWSDERKKRGEKHAYASVVVGSMQLPPALNDKGIRLGLFAEFSANVGPDHGAIYGSPEAARDELRVLANAFDAELKARSLRDVESSVLTVGFCVWPRDANGTLGEIKKAA